MIRIAHVSDLHVLSSLGAEWRRVLYRIRDDGEISSVEAWVLDPATLELGRRELPTAGESA